MKPLTLAVALLLTTAAAADELYLPLAPDTEVEIANASPRRAFVELELLGGAKWRVRLQGGERMPWSARGSGVLRVAGSAEVTARTRRGDAVVSVPALRIEDVVDRADAPSSAAPWRSAMLIVNPRNETVVVTVDGVMQSIAPRGVVRGTSFRSETPLLAFAHDVNDATGAEVFSAITLHARTLKRRAVRSATPPPSQPQTVVLAPSKDNTLYETANGETSNGAGPHFFAGTTQGQSRRRGLVAFDVAAQVPPGSRITKVTLTMRVSQTISGAEPVALHRAGAEWGEGTSNAGSIRDGGGAASTNNDATWRHTFFPDRRWTNAGGDFDAAPDASSSVTTSGTWESAAMTARVQQWLDQPASNFGWIVLGNEARSGTAKRFDSREVPSASSRPSLTIEFAR